MAQLRWSTLVPLGKITVTGGTTQPLDVNCGALGGQITPATNPLSVQPKGTPLRQIILTADKGNGGQIYLLPNGYKASTGAAFILACIPPGDTAVIPYGQPFENGILPENFVVDGDSGTNIVYGCGILS